MNKIHIVQQRKNGTEPLREALSSSQIDYIAKAIRNSNDVDTSLVSAIVNTAFEDSIETLITDGSIDVSITGHTYFRIKDSSANSICASTWGDGVGISSQQASVPTTVGTSFKGNTFIKSFDEFEKFTGIAAVNGASNNGAFQGCASLTTISLPSTVTTINTYAFNGCSALRTVKNAGNLQTIGANAFQNCTMLEEFERGKLKNVGASAFTNCYRFNGGDMSVLESIGANAFQNCLSIKTVDIQNAKNTIGNYAFAGCTGLTDVSIGDGVTSIGQYCFNGDSNLQSVDFGGASCSIQAYAFNGCSSLVSLQNTNNVTSIGNYAFQQTGPMELNLEGVTSIPGTGTFMNSKIKTIDSSTITSIANGGNNSGAFYNCTNLTSVNMPNLTSVGNYSFQNCSSIVNFNFDNIKYVGSLAFSNALPIDVVSTKINGFSTNAFMNSKITSFTSYTLESIPSSASTVGVFRSCKNLVSVDIPACKSIGSHAFRECTALSSVNISSAENVGSSAFYQSGPIQSINAPNLISLGAGAFGGSKIKSFSAPLLESIPGVSSYLDAVFISCTSLTSVNLPSCKSIGKFAFRGCTALSSVSIQSIESIDHQAFYLAGPIQSIDAPNLTSIGTLAFTNTKIKSFSAPLLESIPTTSNWSEGEFVGCNQLTYVNIPKCKSIGLACFRGCTALTTINIPLLESVPDMAFYQCSNLTQITFQNTSVIPMATVNSFGACGKLQHIYVPADLVDSYKTATNWSSYASKITAIPS